MLLSRFVLSPGVWGTSGGYRFTVATLAQIAARRGPVGRRRRCNFVEEALDFGECPVPLTVRGTQALVSFAPLAFKLFFAARQKRAFDLGAGETRGGLGRS